MKDEENTIHLFALDEKSEDKARKWSERTSDVSYECERSWHERCREIDDSHRLDIANHGMLDFLLLGRTHPAAVAAGGDALEGFLKNAREKGQLEWLKKDAFLFFLTDAKGMAVAEKEGLDALPWQYRTQRRMMAKLETFAATSIMRGFSRPLENVRKKTAAFAKRAEPDSRREKTGEKPFPSPVMILGPSRSGKELAAECLLNISGRKPGSEAIGCAMLDSHLLVDKIFGHYKYAFTGADTDQDGVLERRHGGALFLDDLDAAPDPLLLQGSLLRYLSTEGEVTRLGHPSEKSKKPGKVSAWLVCSTNKSPRDMIRGGLMREDFLNRFFQFVIVPSFRQRPEDIPFIAKQMWNEMWDKSQPRYRRLDLPALRWLRDRNSPWPGNAGELKALLVCAKDFIEEDNALPTADVFQTVASRGDDYLDWYYGHFDPPEKPKRPAARKTSGGNAQNLIASTGTTRKKSEMETEEQNLFDKTLSLLTPKGQAALKRWQKDSQNTTNPSRVQTLRLLLYLAEPDNPERKATRNRMKKDLNLSWSTIDKIVGQLKPDFLAAESGNTGRAVCFRVKAELLINDHDVEPHNEP